MPAWKSHPFIQTHYAANLLEQLEQELLDLSMHATAEDEITWGMCQIASQRVWTRRERPQRAGGEDSIAHLVNSRLLNRGN
jgi:hypothetical protein